MNTYLLNRIFRKRAIIRTVVFGASLTLFFFAASSFVQAQERILNFDSDIIINSDSSLDVTETITVYAQGREIKRGIYRDFPTIYKEKDGKTYKVGMEIVSVTRDGKREEYHQTSVSNGKRFYLGDKNVFLSSGEYTYMIRYRTTGQIGYYENRDELYWNVTGNGWVFPIEKASARVHLPGNFSSQETEFIGYTGSIGSKEQAVAISMVNGNTVEFRAKRPLDSYEGLTIVASFAKGHVKVLSREQFIDKTRTKGDAKKSSYILFFLALFILAYYLFAWMYVGMDPDRGTIIPLYHPPKDLTPDAMRYLIRMKYDNKSFTVMIIQQAVKGALKIIDKRSKIGPITLGGEYSLKKSPLLTGQLTTNEKAFYDKLFDGGRESLALKNTNHSHIQSAITQHQKILKKSIHAIYFYTNMKYFVIGILLSVAILYYTFKELNYQNFDVFAVLVTWLALIFINVLFQYLMKAPTLKGRALMDKIEGFKMFLKATEKDRLRWLDVPAKTPQLYEDYLPYAIALDVEDKWSKQFTKELQRAAAEGYTPVWYVGSGHFDGHAFAHDLGGSFSSAISAASQAPGSSSGSGGGGFSGGGGGGGGGGGW